MFGGVYDLGDDVITPVGYGGSKTAGGGGRKMKLGTQIMILVLCAVSLVAMTGITAASNVANADDGAREIGGSTYSFSIGPGGSYYQSSGLYAVAPEDYDVWVMTVTERCTVTVEVVDCCIMGDTMVLKAGPKLLHATSPDTIVASKTLEPGTYRFYTGYADCPGGYPAGYHIEVYAT